MSTATTQEHLSTSQTRSSDWLEEKFRRELEEDTKRKLMARTERLLKESGLSEAIKSKNFDSFTTQYEWQNKAKQLAMRYADNPQRWFAACGQSGSGKTHLCTAIAGKLLGDGIPVHYMLWRQDLLRATGYDGEEYRRELRNCSVLYIDDLFKGGISPAQIQLAFDILDARYRKQKRTIISTEYNLGELAEIDEAIAGRIRQMTRGALCDIKKDASRNWRTRNV